MLPIRFKAEMHQILNSEYEAFMDSIQKKPLFRGIRRNTQKIDEKDFEERINFLEDKIEWCPSAYYVSDDEKPGKDAYYHAGLFYLQEPSAMIPVEILDPKPYNKVLDLCAAPGGKTTQIGNKMENKGILIANDISPKRMMPLKRNIQSFGLSNTMVLNEKPKVLQTVFEGYFDKILVDAPCSGEGMFRKQPQMIKYYEKNEQSSYQQIQREVLASAAKMLKPGGQIVYATCTFSVGENEDIISWFLETNRDFELLHAMSAQKKRGIVGSGIKGMEEAVRVWPHLHKGEGHFAALLQKKDGAQSETFIEDYPVESFDCKNTKEFFASIGLDYSSYTKGLLKIKEKVYWRPWQLNLPLSASYHGVEVGYFKNTRFMPSQAFAMSIEKEAVKMLRLDSRSIESIKYLKGETLYVEAEDGWHLVGMDGFPLGWGKVKDGLLKNHYLKEWRMK
jgi:NOL1/NOP2/sun family putative RNA methylase